MIHTFTVKYMYYNWIFVAKYLEVTLTILPTQHEWIGGEQSPGFCTWSLHSCLHNLSLHPVLILGFCSFLAVMALSGGSFLQCLPLHSLSTRATPPHVPTPNLPAPYVQAQHMPTPSMPFATPLEHSAAAPEVTMVSWTTLGNGPILQELEQCGEPMNFPQNETCGKVISVSYKRKL